MENDFEKIDRLCQSFPRLYNIFRKIIVEIVGNHAPRKEHQRFLLLSVLFYEPVEPLKYFEKEQLAEGKALAVKLLKNLMENDE